MILKLGMDHRKLDVYKIYINHGPGLTSAYFTADQIWSKLLIMLIPRPDVKMSGER